MAIDAKELNEIRARLVAIKGLYPIAVNAHIDARQYYAILDKWDDPIIAVRARFLRPEKVQAATQALLALPADMDKLLARVEELENTLQRIAEYKRYNTRLDLHHVQKLARQVLNTENADESDTTP